MGRLKQLRGFCQVGVGVVSSSARPKYLAIYGNSRVLIIAIVIMVLGRCLIVGHLDP